MRLQKQIKKWCKAKAVQKRVHFTEKICEGFDNHIKFENKKTVVKLYGQGYELDRAIYRIVQRTTYKHRFAYKVYNKAKCFYEIYSPYFREFITV